MTAPTIAVYTHTGLIPAAFIQACVAAAQVALTRDFAPHWSDAKLVYVPPGGTIQLDWWQAVFFDHSDQADALGYHETTPGGQPIASIFAADCIASGDNWNVTFTHEIWEMIVDPMINQTVTVGDTVYALETADACEDDTYAQRVNGHMISNAVTPAWFDPAGVAPFTMYPCAAITAPFMLAPGGYIGERVAGGDWTQKMARGVTTPRMKKKPTSRTMRRFAA